jgi:hypothetical protein
MAEFLKISNGNENDDENCSSAEDDNRSEIRRGESVRRRSGQGRR